MRLLKASSHYFVMMQWHTKYFRCQRPTFPGSDALLHHLAGTLAELGFAKSSYFIIGFAVFEMKWPRFYFIF